MPEPPDDPRQTADLVPDQQCPTPETVDAGTGVESTGTTAPYLRPPPAAAPTLPGYRIREEIARGGMGRVYAGYDLTLEREIAIKTLLPGADAERFVTEAKITAKLPHPGIPPVHALGTLADGTPWLAMKLIHGRTLAELLKQRPSPQHESSRYVQVFEQIAQAVRFAHSRGIIHRDLKPANVMVGEFGEVQVMDWGLAKDLSSPGRDDSSRDREGAGELDDNVHHTAAGAIMGTPGYMAPEQARGELVDARADVFALGSILAAILTGKPAFVGHTSHETIEKAAAADLADVQERLANCGADAELVSLARRCLAANAAERFADGREVASEVAAYRAAVEARLRQAELEQQRALVREAEQRKRRRVVQVGAGIIAAVLLAGIIGTGWGLIAANQARDAEKRRADTEAAAKQDADAQRDQARQERDAKDAALKAEEQAKLQAEARRQEAERNLAFAKKGNELLGSVFTGLDPKANYATVSELRDALKANLEKAVRELEGTAIGEPLEVAGMQNTLGLSLLGLGEPKLAITVFEKALATRQAQLGPDHPDTLISMNNLASGYRAAGQLDRALPLFEETLKLFKAKLGPDHPDTLQSMNNLALGYRAAGQLDRALPLYEETLKLRKAKLGPDHPDTLISMNNLAEGYRAAGQLDRALPLFEETLKLRKAKLGPDHPSTLTSMNNLASGYRAAGQLAKALPLYEETLKLTRAKLGPDHPDTLISMNNLALGYQAAGQLDRALPLYEETLKLTRAKLGPDHPNTLTSMNNLALGYQAAGQLDRALPLYEETLKLTKAKLGPDHPSTLTSMNNLASGYRAAGQLDRALPLLEETLKLTRAKLGPDHPNTLTSMNNLALGYRAAGQLDRALPLYEETLKLRKAKLGPDHPDTLTSMNNLAEGYQAAGQLDRALPLLEETLRLQKAKLGPDHPDTLISMNNLAEGYRAAGQLDRALPLYEETLKLTKAKRTCLAGLYSILYTTGPHFSRGFRGGIPLSPVAFRPVCPCDST